MLLTSPPSKDEECGESSIGNQSELEIVSSEGRLEGNFKKENEQTCSSNFPSACSYTTNRCDVFVHETFLLKVFVTTDWCPVWPLESTNLAFGGWNSRLSLIIFGTRHHMAICSMTFGDFDRKASCYVSAFATGPLWGALEQGTLLSCSIAHWRCSNW